MIIEWFFLTNIICVKERQYAFMQYTFWPHLLIFWIKVIYSVSTVTFAYYIFIYLLYICIFLGLWNVGTLTCSAFCWTMCARFSQGLSVCLLSATCLHLVYKHEVSVEVLLTRTLIHTDFNTYFHRERGAMIPFFSWH